MKNLLLVFIVSFASCQSKILSPQNSILGDWHYVGTFSNLVDYRCLVCEDYDYEKSKYNLLFNADNTYSARINLLIAQGTFTFKTLNFNKLFENGDFENTKLQILNKPPQTEADSKFIELFEKSNSFYATIKSGNDKFSLLNLSKKGQNEYLLFAKK